MNDRPRVSKPRGNRDRSLVGVAAIGLVVAVGMLLWTRGPVDSPQNLRPSTPAEAANAVASPDGSIVRTLTDTNDARPQEPVNAAPTTSEANLPVDFDSTAYDGIPSYFDVFDEESGERLPIVRVEVTPRGSTTRFLSVARGPSGWFHAPLRRDGSFSHVLAAHFTIGSVPAGGTAELPERVVLRRLVEIRGRVVDAQGSPIESARIEIYPPNSGDVEADPILTDPNGRYAIEVRPWQRQRIVASRDGFAPGVCDGEYAQFLGSEPRSVADIVLERGYVVRGRVVACTDATAVPRVLGRPIAGARIRSRTDPRSTATDATGAFEFGPVQDGSELIAAVDGFVPQKLLLVSASAASQGIEFALVPLGVLRGRVLDEAGLPLEGFAVEARERSRAIGLSESQAQFADGEMKPRSRVTSSKDGSFVIDGVVPGIWRLRARSESRGFGIEGEGSTADAEIVLRARPGESPVRVRGRALSRIDGRPVPEFRIAAVLPAAEREGASDPVIRQGRVLDAATGAFEVWIDRPRTIAIECQGDGFKKAVSEDCVVPALGRDGFDVLLDEGAVVEGFLRDPHGRPLEGVDIGFEASGPSAAREDRGIGRTDRTGHYRIGGLGAGNYGIKAWRGRYSGARWIDSELVVMPQQTTLTDFEARRIDLTDSAALRSQVTLAIAPWDREGGLAPPRECELRLTLLRVGSDRVESHHFVMGSKGGRIDLPDVAPGRYEWVVDAVEFHGSGQRSFRAKRVVDPATIDVPEREACAFDVRGHFEAK